MALYSLKGEQLQPLDAAGYPEQDLENWLERNPTVLADGEPLLVIGRQVPTEAGPIDLLALNAAGDLVVIELKRGRTPREAIAQALDYLSVVEDWDPELISTTAQQYLRAAGSTLSTVDEALAEMNTPDGEEEDAEQAPAEVRLNARQHVFVVAQEISPALRRIANLLNRKGLLVRCVEFRRYLGSDGTSLADVSTVVRPEDVGGGSDGPRTRWTLETFRDELEAQIGDDDRSLQVAQRLLEFAESQDSAGSGRLTMGTSRTGTAVYRCPRPAGPPVSFFGLTARGELGIFYSDIRRKVDAQTYDGVIADLASIPTFADIKDQVGRGQRGFGLQRVALYPINGAFRKPDELDRFLNAVRRFGDHVKSAPSRGAE